MIKQCSKCKMAKDASEFYKDKSCKDGLHSSCKKCADKVTRRWSKTEKGKRLLQKYYNSDERKSYILEYNYGITLEQYDQMYVKQNGICAICGDISKNGRRLCVDHDHKTGKVRALLCDRCNHMLGYTEENVTILQSAINYLHDHRS